RRWTARCACSRAPQARPPDPDHQERQAMTELPAVKRVAVVLFDGFTVLDVYGPGQAFGATRVTKPDGTLHRFFQVFTVAERTGPIKSGEGPSTHADYTFDDAPDFDILVAPGGFATRAAVNDEGFLTKLGAISRRAPITTTVCTGSALLAPTGTLDVRPAHI